MFSSNIGVSLKTAAHILAAYPDSARVFAGSNLTCAGCYACANAKKPDNELSHERAAKLLGEASELGVNVVLLAGGEPLLSQGWLEALGAHGEMAGIVFTNGTLFDESRRAWFACHRHIIPAISIEGGREQTDARRGNG